MKKDTIIATPYDNGTIFQHFGRCPSFMLYKAEEDGINKIGLLDASGSGHEALGGLLKENGVDVLICGGIGEGAIAALNGITIFSGVSGSCDQAVVDFINGQLDFSLESCQEDGYLGDCGHCCH